MSHPALSALIPAAGASERLGQPKQLVRIDGNSLLRRSVNVVETLGPLEIIVVTGADAKSVENAVRDSSVRCIRNPDWSAGMGGSIATGATSINPGSQGVLILLCDQWRIEAQDLKKLTDIWKSDPQRIVVAESQGRYMPPVIFPSECFDELRGLQGDQGARSLLMNHPDLLTPVAMENAVFDLDTKSQLDELSKFP